MTPTCKSRIKNHSIQGTLTILNLSLFRNKFDFATIISLENFLQAFKIWNERKSTVGL